MHGAFELSCDWLVALAPDDGIILLTNRAPSQSGRDLFYLDLVAAPENWCKVARIKSLPVRGTLMDPICRIVES